MRALIDLGELPLHTGPHPSPVPCGRPVRLPLRIGYGDGRIRQLPDASVAAALASAYAAGSMIGTPLVGTGCGRRYADDFCRFLDRGLTPGCQVAELGCGAGYLLQWLAARGAHCIGLEPGPQAGAAASSGLHVIREAFPSPQLAATAARCGGYDRVVHYCVLEHLEDPVASLAAQAALLAPAGRIVLAVPDAAPYLAAGDISVFAHEHWSYFTATSLHDVLVAAGLLPLEIEHSGFGGLLYAQAARPDDAGATPTPCARPAPIADEPWYDLDQRVASHLERGRQVLEGPDTVGAFPGVRLLNLIHLLATKRCPRLFDDDARLHGQYFPPLQQPVESRADLLHAPVATLLLTSIRFAPALAAELATEPALARTRLTRLHKEPA